MRVPPPTPTPPPRCRAQWCGACTVVQRRGAFTLCMHAQRVYLFTALRLTHTMKHAQTHTLCAHICTRTHTYVCILCFLLTRPSHIAYAYHQRRVLPPVRPCTYHDTIIKSTSARHPTRFAISMQHNRPCQPWRRCNACSNEWVTHGSCSMMGGCTSKGADEWNACVACVQPVVKLPSTHLLSCHPAICALAI
jgi:hypothetical protein